MAKRTTNAANQDKGGRSSGGPSPLTGRKNDQNTETRIGRDIQPQPNGCWLYRGKADDYGVTMVNGERVRVHRFVYETMVGQIPEGHHVHHDCETPGCCNPSHLRTLTPSEHMSWHRTR